MNIYSFYNSQQDLLVIEQDNSNYKLSPNQEKWRCFTKNHLKHITNIKKKILLGSGDLYFVNISSLIHTDNLFKEKKMKICFSLVFCLYYNISLIWRATTKNRKYILDPYGNLPLGKLTTESN